MPYKKCPCGKQPNFNISGKKPICCKFCKTDDMINVVNKICTGYNAKCPVRTYVSNGHKYCMSCDPNDTRRKQYKRYEEEFFVSHILGSNNSVIINQTIHNHLRLSQSHQFRSIRELWQQN